MSRPSNRVLALLDQLQYAGRLACPTVVGSASNGGRNPTCTLFFQINNETIADIRFQTNGCGYLIAACSSLAGLVNGKSIHATLELSKAALIKDLDGLPSEREFCADLALSALHDAVSRYQSEVAPKPG